MKHRSIFVAIMLLTLIVSAGCGLLGVGNGVSPTPEAEVEATLQTLAAAGEVKDVETLKRHLAESIVAQMKSNGTVMPAAATPIDQDVLVDSIESAWADKVMKGIALNLHSIDIDGDVAIADGDFTITFADEANNESYCAGTGTTRLVHSAGKWKITQVTVTEASCTFTPPGDPAPGEPGEDEEPNEPGEPTNPTSPYAYFDACRYLVLGANGEQVKFVQEVLTHTGDYSGLIDGDFGPMTEASVKSFQERNSLYVDGEVGPKTIAVMDELLKDGNGYFACGVTDSQPSAGETFVTETSLRPGTSYETRVLTYESTVPGPTLVFVGCIHGNEKSGHLALTEAIDRGITISRGRLVLIPEFNRNGCNNNKRTYNGYDFNRLFPVGKTPTLALGRDTWDLVKSQPNLAFVVDFHDGFNNSLANTLIHSRQSEAGSVSRKLRDALNDIRPSGSNGPAWRAFTEPIGGSLTRKVGRDLGIPAVEVELAGRTNPDPISLRKEYAWTLIRLLGREYDMEIMF